MICTARPKSFFQSDNDPEVDQTTKNAHNWAWGWIKWHFIQMCSAQAWITFSHIALWESYNGHTVLAIL